MCAVAGRTATEGMCRRGGLVVVAAVASWVHLIYISVYLSAVDKFGRLPTSGWSRVKVIFLAVMTKACNTSLSLSQTAQNLTTSIPSNHTVQSSQVGLWSGCLARLSTEYNEAGEPS